ncbi:MAG: hypothetical protein AABY07_04555 [Nanoarchaeota archaeon]
MKRGQAVVTDLFIAIAVFIVLVTITTVIWDLYTIRLKMRQEYEDMIVKNLQISDQLVKNPGVPNDWEYVIQQNPDYVDVLGLAFDDRILSSKKVEMFRTNMTNQKVKDILKIGLYNYYFVIKEQNGTPILAKGNNPIGSFNTVNLARLVRYKDRTRIMEFALWK